MVPSGHGVAAGHTVDRLDVREQTRRGRSRVSDSRGNTYGVNVDSRGAQRLIVCSAHASAGLAPGATITIRYPAFNGSSASSANDFSGVRAAARVDKTNGAGANRCFDRLRQDDPDDAPGRARVRRRDPPRDPALHGRARLHERRRRGLRLRRRADHDQPGVQDRVGDGRVQRRGHVDGGAAMAAASWRSSRRSPHADERVGP